MPMIDGYTKLLGVMGHPVEHSLSPRMHNAAIAHLCLQNAQLNYVYLPFPVAPERLEAAIAGFEAIGVQGFNVTLPHKQAIMGHLQAVTELAQVVGAVNTVYRTDRGWMGTNTDIEGFLAPLREVKTPWNGDWRGKTAVILGNGGAARAVVAGCAQIGCQEIQVVGRDPDKRYHFLHSWAGSALADNLSVHPWESVPKLLAQAHLVVNTTPVGMAPKADASPLPKDAWKIVQPGAIAYDLIYTPRPTRFLQEAQAHGITALDGLEMLVQQGAAALSLWLQQPAPIAIMRQAALDHFDNPS